MEAWQPEGLQRHARRRGHRLRPRDFRQGRAAGERLHAMRPATVSRRQARADLNGVDRPEEPGEFMGYSGSAADVGPAAHRTGLHIEIQLDRATPIGKTRQTRHQRCGAGSRHHHHHGLRGFHRRGGCRRTRSMAYRNWLGLMNGALTASFEKGGKTMKRTANPDRDTPRPTAARSRLPGRSLLFIRNVGHLMTSPAILLPRRQRDRRRHPGRRGHHPHRPARHRGRAPQQPHGLDLHRQAQDARARRSGLHQRAVRRASRICSAWSATPSRWA